MNELIYLYIHYLSISVKLLTVYSTFSVFTVYSVVWTLNFSLIVLFM